MCAASKPQSVWYFLVRVIWIYLFWRISQSLPKEKRVIAIVVWYFLVRVMWIYLFKGFPNLCKNKLQLPSFWWIDPMAFSQSSGPCRPSLMHRLTSLKVQCARLGAQVVSLLWVSWQVWPRYDGPAWVLAWVIDWYVKPPGHYLIASGWSVGWWRVLTMLSASHRWDVP